MNGTDIDPTSDLVPPPPSALVIDLVVPPDKTRRDLAVALANAIGGTVGLIMQRSAAPIEVPGLGPMHGLAPAFEVRDADGAWFAMLVDGTAGAEGAGTSAGDHPGSFRVVSDDPGILDTLAPHVNAMAGPAAAIGKASALLGGLLEQSARDTWRLRDRRDKMIAMAVAVPAGREQGCRVLAEPPTPCGFPRIPIILEVAAAHDFLVAAQRGQDAPDAGLTRA